MREERYRAWVERVGGSDLADRAMVLTKRPSLAEGVMVLDCEDGAVVYLPILFIKRVVIKPEENS